MNPPPRVSAAGLTDRGRQRARNEDGFVCEPELGLFAVADGLGGLPKGDVASRITLDRLVDAVAMQERDGPPDWQAVFSGINAVVVDAGKKLALEGIGTTLTALRLYENRFVGGHLGDSGLFVFRQGAAPVQITKDHTVAQEMIDEQGPEIADSIPESYHHTLTQCIGQMNTPAVQLFTLEAAPGTRYVLYTDGVTKTQNLAELASMVAAATSPEALVRTIVDLANARGGPDNVTAVAVFC